MTDYWAHVWMNTMMVGCIIVTSIATLTLLFKSDARALAERDELRRLQERLDRLSS
jgi:hypothetical protein